MERFLGPLVVLTALVALTACGDDPEERADDPATQGQTDQEPTDQEPTDAAEPQVVDIVSGVATGGTVTDEAFVIESQGALTRFLRQFDSPPFVGDLTAAIEAHPLDDGRVLGLAVIEISCNEPPSATVTEEDGGFRVSAGKVVNPHQECYAPVTSVAVLDLPAG